MPDMDNEEGSGVSDESESITIIGLIVIGAIVLISIIITAVTVSLCCWCYYSGKRKRNLFALKNSRRPLVSDDLKFPGNESQSMINISNLDTKKVKYLRNNNVLSRLL